MQRPDLRAFAFQFADGKVYHGSQDPDSFYPGKGLGGNIGPWPWDGRKETQSGFIPHPRQMYFYADDADPDMDYRWEHTFGRLSVIPEYAANVDKGTPGYRGWRLSGKPWRYTSDDDRDPMRSASHLRRRVSLGNLLHGGEIGSRWRVSDIRQQQFRQ